jgi:PhnB protein
MTDSPGLPGAPEGVSGHAIVAGADAAVRWYCDVFGAEERSRITLPDGRLIDVHLALGSSELVLADEFPEHGALAPTAGVDPSAVFYLHLADVDAVWNRAVAAGAEVVRPLQDVFWGEREGQITDPYGYRWGLTQHVRDVAAEEKAQGAAAQFGM